MSAAELAFEEMLARARAMNIRHAWGFAASIGVLIVFFAIANWSSILIGKHQTSNAKTWIRSISGVSRPITRISRGVYTGSWLLLPGRILLITAYFGLNLTLLFTHLDLSQELLFAKRCGWMTLCNLCLTVFLALKNTPLSPLAGRSYESINVLHRCCGYTTILFIILHSTNYVAALFALHAQVYLMQSGQYAGAVAAISLLLIGISGIRFIRQRQYEVFFIAHVVLVTVILITGFLHVKQIDWPAMIIIIVAASMWFADRSLRFSRWIYHGYGNSCTLIPLPEGATRVIMQRDIKAQPGSHAFLWIPRVAAFQTHPFTLVSNNPAEFVISAQDGFTKRLHDLALQHPQATYRAAIEGPYGHVPNSNGFEKVVLISGGSGITFTMALAMDWLRKSADISQPGTLDFTWVVKTREHLDWFEAELKELERSPLVNLAVHVTALQTPKAMDSQQSSGATTPDSETEERILSTCAKPFDSSEKADLAGVIQLGRPDLNAVLERTLDGMSQTQRVLVAVAGPASLRDSSRMAVKSRSIPRAPSISMHLEEFGW